MLQIFGELVALMELLCSIMLPTPEVDVCYEAKEMLSISMFHMFYFCFLVCLLSLSSPFPTVFPFLKPTDPQQKRCGAGDLIASKTYPPIVLYHG